MSILLSRFTNRATLVWERLLSRLPHPSLVVVRYLFDCLTKHGIPNAIEFDPEQFKQGALSFVRSMSVGRFDYRYSASVATPSLYSSVYACLILSMFSELDKRSSSEKAEWAAYFDSYQSPDDGLFRDPAVMNDLYEESDWWGARHLALHLIAAYAALGHVPKYGFRYLDHYKGHGNLQSWLDQQDWEIAFPHSNDIDNKLMNIACVLQYERDYRASAESGKAVVFIQSYLLEKRNPHTGLWGACDFTDPKSLSRAVQFAYHLLPIYFYDDLPMQGAEKIIDAALKTQNSMGGFGVQSNSSACEDIDSIYILCRLARQTDYRAAEVRTSILRALVWVLANQNEDGGFVFARNEPLVYGHPLMSSSKNQSAMFSTWFRSLTVAYIASYLGLAGFNFEHCPGLQFQ